VTALHARWLGARRTDNGWFIFRFSSYMQIFIENLKRNALDENTLGPTTTGISAINILSIVFSLEESRFSQEKNPQKRVLQLVGKIRPCREGAIHKPSAISMAFYSQGYKSPT
jgi:hypothetical protein